MTDPRLFLVDILERARRVTLYAAEGREAFDSSTLIQDGILQNLAIIGEAAKGIEPEHRARWPHVPWRRMAGLRDVLIHAYRDVDNDAIWRATQGAIRDLIPRIEEILRELGVDPDQVP